MILINPATPTMKALHFAGLCYFIKVKAGFKTEDQIKKTASETSQTFIST